MRSAHVNINASITTRQATIGGLVLVKYRTISLIKDTVRLLSSENNEG